MKTPIVKTGSPVIDFVGRNVTNMNMAKEFAQGTVRSFGDVALTGMNKLGIDNRKEFKANNPVTNVMFGKDVPVRSFTGYKEAYGPDVEKYGKNIGLNLNRESAGTVAGAGMIGLALTDVVSPNPVPKDPKDVLNIASAIAKTSSIKKIASLANKLGITDPNTLKKFVNMSDANKIFDTLTSAKKSIAPKVGKVDVPKTVRVWHKSKFSDRGAYVDMPVIRKENNITLYQGGSADGRQYWTPNKKYASQFGEVKEKTGTFYQVDNGNRMTDVYVEANPLSQPTPKVGKVDVGANTASRNVPKTGQTSGLQTPAIPQNKPVTYPSTKNPLDFPDSLAKSDQKLLNQKPKVPVDRIQIDNQELLVKDSSGSIISPTELNINGKVKTQEEIQTSIERAYMNSDLQNPTVKQGFKEMLGKALGQRHLGEVHGTQVAEPFATIGKGNLTKKAVYQANMDAIKEAHGIKTGNKEAAGWAAKWKPLSEELYNKAKANNPDMGKIDDYFPQLWKTPEDKIRRLIDGSPSFKRKFPNAQPRSLTFEQGLELGLKPKHNTFSEFVASYVKNLEEVNANNALVTEMKNNGILLGADAAKLDSTLVPVNIPGIRGPMTPVGDGKFVAGNYYTTPDLAKVLDNVFTTYKPTTVGEKLWRAGAWTSKRGQEITLSGGIPGTPFNFFGEGVGMVKPATAGDVVSPIKATTLSSMGDTVANTFFKKHMSSVDDIVGSGRRLDTSYTIDKVANKGFIKNVFGDTFGDKWHKALDEPTFKRLLPIEIITDYEHTLKSLVKGGMERNAAKEIALEKIDNFHAISKYADEAMKDPRTADKITALFFAPKYRSALIKFYNNTFGSVLPVHVNKVGKFSEDGAKALKVSLNNPFSASNNKNTRFLIGAALTYFAYDKINKEQTGNHMWENPKGKELMMLIDKGDGTTIGVPFLPSLAAVPRMMYNTGKSLVNLDLPQATKDATAILSMPLKTAGDIANNTDYFGNEIYNKYDDPIEKGKKSAGYAFRQFQHPYTKGGLDIAANNGLPEGVAKWTGAKAGKSGLQIASEASETPLRWYKTQSIKEAPMWEKYDIQKKIEDVKTAVKTNKLSPEQGQKQLDSLQAQRNNIKGGPDNGQPYERTNAQGKKQTMYTDAEGNYKFADDSDKAQEAMKKSQLEVNGKVGDKERINGKIFTKTEDGIRTTKVENLNKQISDYKLEKTITRAKKSNDWKLVGESYQLKEQSLKKDIESLDPEVDQITILRKQEAIQKLYDDWAKWQERGYITKGKSGKGSKKKLPALAVSAPKSTLKLLKTSTNIPTMSAKSGLGSLSGGNYAVSKPRTLRGKVYGA